MIKVLFAFFFLINRICWDNAFAFGYGIYWLRPKCCKKIAKACLQLDKNFSFSRICKMALNNMDVKI